MEQKRHWCQELKRLILENFKVAIPEKAKELVMKQLGKSREEEGGQREINNYLIIIIVKLIYTNHLHVLESNVHQHVHGCVVG